MVWRGRTARKCEACKGCLNQPQGCILVRDQDPKNRERVLKREAASARCTEQYREAQEERRRASMGPGERYWHDYFEGYRAGSMYDFDDESEIESEPREAQVEDTHADRDFARYYHLKCFVQRRPGQYKEHLDNPQFDVDVSPEDQSVALRELSAMRGGGSDQSQRRGVLSASDYEAVRAQEDALRGKKVPELKRMLESAGQGGCSNLAKHLLVARVAEQRVLGSLPRCPRCGGGRSGNGGNLVWNRENGQYSCSGFFRMSGHAQCSGPKPEDVVRRPWRG